MRDDNLRNTAIFGVCAVLILVLYQAFVINPAAKRREAELARQAPAAAAPGQAAAPNMPQIPQALTRQAAAAASPRVRIVTPSLTGSLSLAGARLDDLYLTQYRQTVEKGSPAVELLRPEGSEFALFADLGWVGQNVAGLPGPSTPWTLTGGGPTLTPTSPITLTYANGQGLTFIRTISVDDRFMFTVRDTVQNATATPITLAPYGSVQRRGVPPDLGKNQIVHEGGIGYLDGRTREMKYPKWIKDGGGPAYTSAGGWVGITDKYWLTALIPDQSERLTGQFRRTQTGPGIYEANFVGQPITIAPGAQATETTHVFAGAKRVPLLREYEAQLKAPRFDDAVDWGNFRLLTRPIFSFLAYIQQHVGTFGISILLLTVAVRLIFFPLANKSYESMTMMRKVQPQMTELRAKYKNDPAKQQQELLALYQREKINPLAGCLPLLLQIPVFYALYKVLTVTLEMRHAPFMGWIKDLSAPDPTTVLNLFGLIPWDVASTPVIGGIDVLVHLGVLPLLYGVTMYLTTAMSPPAPDPVQQKIFQFMPLIFTFIMAPFAVGLLIYWTWSNVLTIIQQYVIMRRFKVDTPIDQLIRRVTGKPAPSA